MIKFLLQVTGWLLAHAPEPVLRGCCVVLGRLLLWLSPRRRRLVFSNLSHAFPTRSRAWQIEVARASSERLFETALLSLAGPFFNPDRIKKIISAAPELQAYYHDHHSAPFPVVAAVPHLAYWETLTWMALTFTCPPPEFGVIFRPLDNPAADAWVKATRERFGMRLLSRKTGLQEAYRILKRKGVVGVLFDQNAGMQGALSTLFGRVCSTTELPGLFAEKTAGQIALHYPRRLGFWRVQLELYPLPLDGTVAGATLSLNRWLERTLESDDTLCRSWLWSHDRWRNQDMPERRFRLEAKRDLLREDLAARGSTEVPKKTRIWIRLPNWLGDVVMALPLLQALRASRPDAELTFIAKPAFEPLLTACGLADRVEPLPPRGAGYFLHFWRKRRDYPDTYVLFTHSVRGDLEAWLTRCPQRFGVVRAGKKRPLLTHAYVTPRDFDGRTGSQLELGERFFRHFGLLLPLDCSPLQLAGTPPRSAPTPGEPRPVIGMIAGSENSPEKRWPIEHWRKLIAALSLEFPYVSFVLFGTANDRPITDAILAGLDAPVENLAGQTNLRAYIDRLLQCTILVGNDTGGMHLGNALGVPVVALFGPTNPVRTGPVFSAPRRILQPPGCPPTGGAEMVQLSPDLVSAAVGEFLRTMLARE